MRFSEKGSMQEASPITGLALWILGFLISWGQLQSAEVSSNHTMLCESPPSLGHFDLFFMENLRFEIFSHYLWSVIGGSMHRMNHQLKLAWEWLYLTQYVILVPYAICKILSIDQKSSEHSSGYYTWIFIQLNHIRLIAYMS